MREVMFSYGLIWLQNAGWSWMNEETTMVVRIEVIGPIPLWLPCG